MRKKQTILLVDDEEGIRKVLGISLSDMGYDVVTAENGEQALKIFQEILPPIVLTDIKMPGINGIELLGKIKEHHPDTEVIMITGHGDMALAIKSLQRNATDFVTKPINDDVLGIALKRAHERLTMRAQLREYTENLENLVQKQASKLVEAERVAAAYQAVTGLSSALGELAGDLVGGITYLNEMPCLVSIHDKNLKIVAINQLYQQRMGNRIGKESWTSYGNNSSRNQKSPVEKTFQTGIGQRSREVIKGLDGADMPVIVHTSPIRNNTGEIELVLEISADATEVERLQEELRTTQQRYQQLFDEVPCYISVQDKEYRLTATNKRFKEDFGEEIGGHCYQVYKHRHSPCRDCPLTRTFEDGQPHQAEMVVTAKTGEHRHVLIWTAPIRNSDGEVTQVMEMSTDITQIRLLQDHLSSLGLIIGTLSHSIKGLLTGLDGGIYTLKSGFAKDDREEIKEGWETVRLMVDRIRDMVLDILYYAKERDLNWETVDVLSFANEIAATVEPKLIGTSVRFVRNFDETLGAFNVDSSVLRSALINILENAVDACTEDKAKKAHRIFFGVSQDTENILFDISDNGLGMDQETKENMFTLFFSSKGHKGTGLGLFISNQIVEQHGGAIHVESTAGKGSHFHVTMPKRFPAIAETTSKTVPPQAVASCFKD
jgi:PAS domain S-box-containing protein